ncbi:WD40 repeat-like protein [Cantharellus anzutake]|uniref:WD40 repeat-like protein n=1 Tax=Cantharellus anzutake TaxID=1750568 RepID=UPI0019034E5A|nr:WD40 repeat-like protein [Cantharellus anzutake]KAF8324332.1 WD40 repeat-like protein [Cantharellus anzutake]
MPSQPRIFQLGQAPLTSHSFNATRDHVAASLNSHEATIFAFDGTEWKPEEVLAEHDKLITSIDWGHLTNRIITCSQDRNAYVWSEVQDPQTGGLTWKPTLVLLRINRAATYVRWSPKEDKFAVASGDRAIAVCSFDAENDWWVAKHLKKPIRSTVLSIDWHPNNVLLAAGSADNKARVLSAYIKDIDKRPPPSVWGEKLPFNTICGEFSSPTGGWVHSVGFSPSGDALAFASHDSSITVVYPGTGGFFNVRTPSLPYVTLAWTSEQNLVAAGHDCQPVIFQGDATNGWFLGQSLDDAASRSASTLTPTATGTSARSTGVGRLNNEAFSRFKNADSRGTPGLPSGLGGNSLGGGGELFTVHQNTITSIRPFTADADGAVPSVSTSGMDGKLVIWNVPSRVVPAAQLTTKLGGLHLR